MDEIEWPELDKAIRKKEEENQRELRELKADLFTEELEEKLPEILALSKAKELLKTREAQVKRLIAEWHPTVYSLLHRVCEGVWCERVIEGREKWKIESKVIYSGDGEGLSLYWEASRSAFMVRSWLTVELCLDDDCRPVEFKVGCREPEYYLSSEVTVDALKQMLLQAFELGAARDLDRKPKQGVPFENLVESL